MIRTIRAALVVGAAALAAAGCGTTTKSGHVGDTFSGGGIQVTVGRIDQHPRVPSDDITGLSSPAPGNRLWIVFELPSSRKPSKIRFAYDDTGSGGSNVSGRPESHERFSWSLS